jgi:hypothetical protein
MNKDDNKMEEYYKNLSLDDIVYLDEDGAEKIEVWKDIPDYEGYYQVSDLGRVKSLEREIWNGKYFLKMEDCIIKQTIGTHNYLTLGLHKEGRQKTKTTHKLVANCFLNHNSSVNRKNIVDHKNNYKKDNRKSNLQLITHRFNLSKDKNGCSSKYTGVSLKENGKFIAEIYHISKKVYLGSFYTEEEAYEYYQNALNAIEKGKEIKVKKAIYSSKNKGISWRKSSKRWIATYYNNINRITKTIGYFKTEIEAYEARENYIKNLNLQNETTLS